MTSVGDVWVYLSATPLLWLTATLLAYLAAHWLYEKANRNPLLNLMRIKDWRARGFAVGVAAHGIGTARAFHVNELAGTFAGLGMGLNALVTALLVPLLLALLD